MEASKSIYRRLLEAGVEVDHHESDLYAPYTDAALEIVRGWLAESPLMSQIPRTFVSPQDGRMWIELPFQYEPFWVGKGVITVAK